MPMVDTDVAGDDESDVLERRIVELETRLAFQEHAQTELSDALAELRAEAERSADLLRRVLEELKLHRGDLMADPADEPPPPHY
jgi:SlyX protein